MRYQEWIEAEAERANNDAWIERFHRHAPMWEDGELTPEELEAKNRETTSQRLRRVERHERLVKGLEHMLQQRMIYDLSELACKRIRELLRENNGNV